MLKDYQDAFGYACFDYLQGIKTFTVIERSDGYIEAANIVLYFTEFNDWPTHVKRAMRYVHGRVLDVGCGAGRHALFLQNKGFDVLGIDVSPMAMRVCKIRGLKKVRVLSITGISSKLGTFDTILMLGGNFGLFANKQRAQWLLRRFYGMTREGAVIIAQSRNIYKTKEPHHLQYQASNRKRGRMAGQIRLRVRYKNYAEPWYDYLLVSPQEMMALLRNTGWRIKKFIGVKNAVYTAIIGKA
jgi:SAM-dependent methyltransferase